MMDEKPTRRRTVLLLFGYVWLTLGFFIGTLTLIGPVRWVTSIVRAEGWGQPAEDLAVRLLIALLVLGTAVTSWIIVRRVVRTQRWWGLAGVTLTTLALALAALGLWMNPTLMAEEMPPADEDARFVFGPYPTAERLQELRDQGFTGVISLLHPAVVPFEPRLLAEEKTAARAAGIPVIHAPMLPWVSDNAASLAKIAALVQEGTGRYYVHCYLGKDRVNVVRQLVERLGGGVGGGDTPARELSSLRALERGAVSQLDEGVFLTPYPTDEEWIGYILAGQVERIVSLLDPENPEDAPWIEKEQTLARRYAIPLISAPIPNLPFEPEKALHAARRVRTLPRPAVVHAFLSPSPATEAFGIAYRSNLPPLPPSLFSEGMAGGNVDVVRANVALGPRPTGREFGEYLKPRGVKGVIHVGPTTGQDVRLATRAGLEWYAYRADDPALLKVIDTGGPWYLYGAELPMVRRLLNR